MFPWKRPLNIQASQKSQTRDAAITVTFLISHRADKQQISKNTTGTVAHQRNAVRIAPELGDILPEPQKRRYLIEKSEIAGRVVPDTRSQETCNEIRISRTYYLAV